MAPTPDQPHGLLCLGAILGNAVLSHPIQPLNLLLEPPEHMLSTAARQGLDLLRTEVRQLGNSVSAALGEATMHWLRAHRGHARPGSDSTARSHAQWRLCRLRRPVPGTTSIARGGYQHPVGALGPVRRCVCRAVFGPDQDAPGGGGKTQPPTPAARRRAGAHRRVLRRHPHSCPPGAPTCPTTRAVGMTVATWPQRPTSQMPRPWPSRLR